MIKVKVTEKYYLEDNFQAFKTNCRAVLTRYQGTHPFSIWNRWHCCRSVKMCLNSACLVIFMQNLEYCGAWGFFGCSFLFGWVLLLFFPFSFCTETRLAIQEKIFMSSIYFYYRSTEWPGKNIWFCVPVHHLQNLYINPFHDNMTRVNSLVLSNLY